MNSTAFLNKSFIDVMDRNRKLVPIKEDGNNLVCRVYIRETKQAKTKERREKEDGSGTELVIVYRDLDMPFDYVGQANAPKKLFFVRTEKEWDALNRVGFRMM